MRNLDFIRATNACPSEGTTERVKRQPVAWDKIFRSHMSDEGSVTRTCKEHLQLNNRKNQTPNLKNGQRIWMDISPKKILQWPMGTRKITVPGTAPVCHSTTDH